MAIGGYCPGTAAAAVATGKIDGIVFIVSRSSAETTALEQEIIDGGGRFLADFTDCAMADLAVGLPMRMVFRKRSQKPESGFINYFWKATPVPGARERMNRIRFDGRVEIRSGLRAGDEVVVKGNESLRSGQPVDVYERAEA